MSFVWVRILSICTRMPFVCHSYVLVCHPYVTRMYSYVICMSLVCTRMSSVCHSYVLVCHPYVTRMYSYVIRMSLVCGFTMNRFLIQIHNILQWTVASTLRYWKHGNWMIQHRCFPVNIAKFLRAPTLMYICDGCSWMMETVYFELRAGNLL